LINGSDEHTKFFAASNRPLLHVSILEYAAWTSKNEAINPIAPVMKKKLIPRMEIKAKYSTPATNVAVPLNLMKWITATKNKKPADDPQVLNERHHHL